MNKKYIIKNLIIFLTIILTFILLYLIINKLTQKSDSKEETFLKNYEVNEYIPMYISDEEMAKIYFNDYIRYMYMNPEKGFELLSKEYKEKKFASLNDFINYANSLVVEGVVPSIDKYSVEVKNDHIIFNTYDKNGNLFIFKTNGVMQYTVYLDDYTVEI